MTELADEEHVFGIHEGDHAHRDAHVEHRVAPLAPRGKSPRIFPQRELAELRERDRSRCPPLALHTPRLGMSSCSSC